MSPGPVQSRLTKTLAVITKKLKWPEGNKIGYTMPERRDQFLNPLLTPPPRSPASPADFRYPEKIGHWKSYGFDYTSPKADAYEMHECIGMFVLSFIFFGTLGYYVPDYDLSDWSKREAFLRTHKREALGIPLIDRNVVDPERVMLPTEEELQDWPYGVTF